MRIQNCITVLLIIIIFIFLFFSVFMLSAGPCIAAMQVKTYEVKVPGDKTVNGPLLAGGKEITIDGEVDGDLYLFGSTVVVNGNIEGDVLALAANLTINGDVSGDLRAACESVEVNGKINGSTGSLSRKVVFSKKSYVARDILMGAVHCELQGTVGGQACGWCVNARLEGEVNNGVKLFNVQNLTVTPSANIKELLYYRSSNKASIDSSTNVPAGVQWEQKEKNEGLISWNLIWFAAGLLIWWVLNIIYPRVWEKMIVSALNQPLLAMGWGGVAFIVVPLVVLLLLFTVVGLPLALIIGGLYIIVAYAGKIITGHTIGYMLSRRWNGKKYYPFTWFIIGYGLLFGAGFLPYLELVVAILAPCWALGAVSWAVLDKRRKVKAAG